MSKLGVVFLKLIAVDFGLGLSGRSALPGLTNNKL